MEAINKFTKLNNQNWASWKFRMEMMLTREELWYVVGTPKPGPAGAAAAVLWEKDDSKARATMGLCIDENQYSLVKTAATAKDFWEQLKSYHEKVTVTSRVSLLKKLCNLNLLEGGDLESHLFEVEDLFERLHNAGQDLENTLKVAMILRSLPDSYSGLVTALESRPDADLTLQLVKSKLLDEYERRKDRSGGSSSETKAMKVSVKSSAAAVSEKTCFFCKKKGHLRRNCRLFQAKQKQDSGEERKSETPKAKQVTSAVLFMVGTKQRSKWIVDSGASSHMTSDKQFFASIDESSAPDVFLADGTAVKSAGCGQGTVYGVDGCGGIVEITLTDVLYVPSLNCGLLSVTKLASKGLTVVCKDDSCDICDGNGKVIAKGVRSGSLYQLKIVETGMNAEATGKHHNVLCQHQWHRRFGHRDPSVVDKIAKDKLAVGFEVRDCGIRLACEACLEGKLSRTPIPKKAERKSTQILDLVHTDLCGPMETPTPSGNRFLMTLIDDYSRYCVVYLLSKKSEAADKIVEYVRYVENLFGRKPRVIRSDGGGEYANDRLRSFFAKEGIRAQFTTAYTPQQNGVAERRNRYLQEMARTMLLDAGLDKKFWGEATLTAAHLQNRLPSRSVDVTPYEKWFNRKPNLDHLKVYGCEAWVHIPDVKRKKFDSKAQKLTFIGYSEQHKAYRFVDLATEKVTVSRDAKFLEMDDGAVSQKKAGCDPVEDEAQWIPDEVPKRSAVPNVEAEPVESEDELEENVSSDKSESEQSEFEHYFDLSDSFMMDDPLEVKSEPNNDVASGSVGQDRQTVRRNRGKLPDRYSDFVVGVATQLTPEPTSYSEAVKCSDSGSWKQAMDDEYQSHMQNGTWELSNLPPGKKLIGSRWVFKTKCNEAGDVVRFKARIVAQGYRQQQGVDFEEVFAPVTRHATLRTLLALAGRTGLRLKHLDVKTAYLYGDIEEELYMRQPPGYAVPGQEEKVCRLRRSIYGLKQSARCWNRKLTNVLASLGFKASTTDPCLFVAERNGKKIYLIVYVDDFLVGCAVEEEISRIFEQLKRHFEINWLGDARFFLGMELDRGDDGIYSLSVKSYIEKVITRLGLENAKMAKTPMDQGYLKDISESAPMKDGTMYRSVVGALMYVATCARPDIATSAAILGRKFSNPNELDWTAAKRVVRFLKGTKDWKLRLGDGKCNVMEAYCDADWAGDTRTRKSMTGFVVFYAGGAVSWTSRRQDCVSLSTLEAEYVALGETCQEVLWMRRLLADLDEKQANPTIVHEDNQGCLSFVVSERTSKRSKHIETKQCFVRDLCERRQVQLQYCPTEIMKADILTKPLGAVKHRQMAELMGLGGNRGPTVEEE